MSDTVPGAKPSFGFGSLDEFEPRDTGATTAARPPAQDRSASRPGLIASKDNAAAPRSASSRAADDAAAKLGFGSREPLVRRRKRQPIEEPVEQINLRAAVADINVFIEWCETNRYSYREGFGELVKHIDLKVA
jgi:hypothetical protein